MELCGGQILWSLRDSRDKDIYVLLDSAGGIYLIVEELIEIGKVRGERKSGVYVCVYVGVGGG